MLNFRNKQILRKISKVGSEVAGLVVQVNDLTNPAKLAAMGFRMAHSYLGERDYPAAVLEEWTQRQTYNQLSGEILRVLQASHPPARTVTCSGNSTVAFWDLPGGAQVGFLISDDSGASTLWTLRKGCDNEALRYAIGRLLWEALGPSVTANLTPGWHPDVILQRDALGTNEVDESVLADELAAWLNPFVKRGIPRTVLLYGQPGTGKSSIMKNIARRLGGLSLRLDTQKLMLLGQESVADLVETLCPSIVLLDDIDRGTTSTILSTLEVLSRTAKVVLASANFLDKLDPALIRAGRFDELREVERLDDAVMDRLIGPGVDPECAAALRKLPVAYIREFHTRREILGDAAAAASVQELVARSEMIAEACGKPKEPKPPAEVGETPAPAGNP